MILQSLASFYDRMVQVSDSGMPSTGFSLQNIHFCLEISKNGAPVTITDMRQHEGKKAFPRKLLVPKQFEEKAGSMLLSQFCWENTGYSLGIDGKGKPERTLATYEAFVSLHRAILAPLDCDAAKIFIRFLDTWIPDYFHSLPFSEEALDQNFVFRIEGEFNFLHESPILRDAWIQFYKAQKGIRQGQCLISGKMNAEIAATHPQIKGVPGAQPAGAALVSFNEKAYESYGKEQNNNSPVSRNTAFAYTTALNFLLDRSRRRKIQIGDATTIFWAQKASPIEDELAFMVDPDLVHDETYQEQSAEQDKKELEKKLYDILIAVASGRLPKEWENDPDNLFFILGLSPNAARISIRFFHVATVRKLTEAIGLHYKQMEIVKQYNNEPEFISPRRILKALAVREDTKNLSPILSGQLMQAIFTGSPYPRSLLTAVMGRIRAEGRIDRIRTGLIKAILMRNKKMEIPVMLDKERRDTGYVLGRLFAILEKLQGEALPGTSATIGDKYFSSAAATPQRTFLVLTKNAKNHLSKLRRNPETVGLYKARDKMITDIVDMLEDYPATLSIEDQSLFTLGYYHQKKDLFTKKSTNETVEE